MKIDYKISLLKAIIATILFYVVYEYANIKIVQNYTKDKSFDLINSFILVNQLTETNSPKVMVFGIDDYYLKNQNMIDDKNRTTYGYIFPNGKIADFIKKIDYYNPKALFIDYDFSFTTSIYGKTLSNEDKALLETLKKNRKYIILLPKTSRYNFIESIEDKEIQELIENQKIRFVSVPLTKSKDNITRRFQSYQNFINSKSGAENNYIIASLELWQLVNGDKNIAKEFSQQHIVENRFIIKDYQKSLFKFNNKYIQKNSAWRELSYYSANYPLNNIPKENFENALILLGANHSSATDIFSVNSKQNPKLSGVEVLANVLMTHFYFDGKLKKFALYPSLLLIFVIYFLSYLLTDRFLTVTPNRLKIILVKQKISKFTISLFISMIIMALVSVVILLNYQKWFDWSSSLMLFGYSATLWSVIWFVVKKIEKGDR